MPSPEELAAIRKLMESVNKQTVSNTRSLGQLAAALEQQKEAAAQNKVIADRALQMCDQLSAKISNLEAKLLG